MYELENLKARNRELFKDYARLYDISRRLIKLCKGDSDFMKSLENMDIAAALDDLEKDLEEHFPCPF